MLFAYIETNAISILHDPEPCAKDFIKYSSGNIFQTNFEQITFLIDKESPFQLFEDSSLKILVYGKIYNTTIEEIANLYRTNSYFNTFDYGTFRGHYNLFIYDKKERKLLLITDQFGLLPLFMYKYSSIFILTTEYESILAHPLPNSKINIEAILDYIYTGSLVNNTFFTYIYMLPSFSVHIIDLKYYTISRHRHLNCFSTSKNDSISYWVEKMTNDFREAVSLIANDQSELNIMLTGGLDTRLILANLTEEQRKKANFITFTVNGVDVNADTDIRIAKELAKQYQLKHQIVSLKEVDLWNNFSLDKFIEWKNYWRKHNNKKYISGLYGTEFLGAKGFYHLKDHAPFLFTNHTTVLRTFNALYKNYYLPKKNYLKGKELNSPNVYYDRLYQIHYYTRSFLSNIYGGLVGMWYQPFTFTKKLYTPFLDTKMLENYMCLPKEIIKKPYYLYNEIYKTSFSSFTKIPVNNTNCLIENSPFVLNNEGISPVDYKSFPIDDVLKLLSTKVSFPLFDLREIRRKENVRMKTLVLNFYLWLYGTFYPDKIII
ncbi:MAG: asparagine synthase-related protein [Bacteroidales bacterium]|nr:asparagine synthase-related protein [Bacteroidales bacterium]